MGWNSSLVVLNDRLGDIRKDENFGPRVADAIARSFGRTHEHEYWGQVIAQNHMDTKSLLVVGENVGKQLGVISHIPDKDDDDDVVDAMRWFLRQKGYMVSKWPKRRK